MPKIFYHTDGRPSPYPTDRETAKRLRTLRYDEGVTCSKCGACSICYTLTGGCIHCARLDAMHYYNWVIAGKPLPYPLPQAPDALDAVPSAMFVNNPQAAAEQGLGAWVRVEPCSRAGHLGLRSINGGCWFCDRETDRRARRATARREGLPHYTPVDACPTCHTLAPRRVRDGACTACDAKPTTSPRQAAIAAGETHYTPTDPCRTCGQCAPRRVNNGQCQGCHPPKRVSAEKDLGELVITRDDAMALGMKVYRTGKACKRGHTAARYVSTRGCVECV